MKPGRRLETYDNLGQKTFSKFLETHSFTFMPDLLYVMSGSTKIFLVVFFCAISINGEYVKKMIKLYGKVTDGSTKETTTDTNSFACVENCFQNPSCVLSFWDSSETCEIYFDQYGGEITVEETTEADLEIVAFKVS